MIARGVLVNMYCQVTEADDLSFGGAKNNSMDGVSTVTKLTLH